MKYWNPRYECRKLLSLLQRGLDIAVFDTETTGVRAGDEIIQFSGIRYTKKDGKYKPADMLDIYIRPKKAVPEEATKVNHITNEFLRDKETAEKVAPKIRKFFGDMKCIFVGYNLQFDIRMLNHMFMMSTGDDFEPEEDLVVDVMKMSMEEILRQDLKGLDDVDPDDPKAMEILKEGHFKQTNCAKYFNINVEGAHSSLVDIQICAKLMAVLLNKFKEETGSGKDLEREKELPEINILSMKEMKYSKTSNFMAYFVSSESGEKGTLLYSQYDKIWEDKEGKFVGKSNMPDFHKKAMKALIDNKKANKRKK